MYTNNRFSFEKLSDGNVRLVVRACAASSDAGDAEVLIDEVIEAKIWASIIATMSHYGEEDYGFYRALNFHMGAPLHPTTPLNQAKLQCSG
jgi:hypothetical protein